MAINKPVTGWERVLLAAASLSSPSIQRVEIPRYFGRSLFFIHSGNANGAYFAFGDDAVAITFDTVSGNPDPLDSGDSISIAEYKAVPFGATHVVFANGQPSALDFLVRFVTVELVG